MTRASDGDRVQCGAKVSRARRFSLLCIGLLPAIALSESGNGPVLGASRQRHRSDALHSESPSADTAGGEHVTWAHDDVPKLPLFR